MKTTMRAVWLESIGAPLRLVERPVPIAISSGVVVSVLAVRIPSYTNEVIRGTLGYDLPIPMIPGPTCIGCIETVGEDVFDLIPGQIVLCNSLLSSADIIGSADEILIGWTGNNSPRSRRMQEIWRNGSFAEKALYPARCLIPLSDAAHYDINRLPFLASLAIADGALKRGELRGGQTVVINGATGQNGSAGVLAALVRGAGRIIITGRNEDKLQALTNLSPRIVACPISGDRSRDAENILKTSEGGADVIVDYLGPTPTPNVTMAAIDALKIGGIAVLAGGVRHKLPLSYSTIMRRQLTVRGSFMFDRATALECWQLIRSGAIDLSILKTQAFTLREIDEAIKSAANQNGFNFTVLLPNA